MRIAVIPAYEPNKELFHKVLQEMSQEDFELVIVDDGSGENYAEQFKEARKYAHVIITPVNRGKGAALKTAFAYIDKHYGRDVTIVTMDCDGQHSTRDVIRVAEAAEKHPDSFVLGSRALPEDAPFFSKLGNYWSNRGMKQCTHLNLKDTQTGLRAFSGKIIPILRKSRGTRYEYETNMLIDVADAKIPFIELPIEVIYIDNNSGSHFNPVKDTLRLHRVMWAYRFQRRFGKKNH